MDSGNISSSEKENTNTDLVKGTENKNNEITDCINENVQGIGTDIDALQNSENLNSNSKNQLMPEDCLRSRINCQDYLAYKFQLNESISNISFPAPRKVIETREIETSLKDILQKMKEVRDTPVQSFKYGQVEVYSRKVFVGGLPPDINELQIEAAFNCYGPLVVDWPYKIESRSCFPPKGFAFLLFHSNGSVRNLIRNCKQVDKKLYQCISSKTIKDKDVEIRPWRVADADFIMDTRVTLDPRKTVFVGGVPRTMKAVELANIMDRSYGGVCYAGIDTDTKLKYPKGSARVAFNNQKSFVASISDRFVHFAHGDINKRVEVKPYLHFDQMCDCCNGLKCYGLFAPFFCANIMCLRYYCEYCWNIIHSQSGRKYHKALTKEFTPRSFTSFRRPL